MANSCQSGCFAKFSEQTFSVADGRVSKPAIFSSRAMLPVSWITDAVGWWPYGVPGHLKANNSMSVSRTICTNALWLAALRSARICNALTHAGKTQLFRVPTVIGTMFVQDTREAAKTQ